MPRTDPLSGHAVLLTRPAGRSAELARRLRALGATVSERPTIAFEGPSDPSGARQAVRRLEQFDWIVFSSATGVKYFLQVCRSASPGAVSPRARLAAVGPGTAASLEQAGLVPALVARQSHAEGLAESLRHEVASGDRVLWVRPEQARSVLSDALEAIGAIVEPVVFYRTIPAAGAQAAAAEVGRGRFDAVVFSSPSTLRMLLEVAETRRDVTDALSRASVIAIGPVTAAALEREGLSPARVAASPRVEAVVAAVLSAVEARTGG